jgi:hypothetical protein
MLPRLCVSQLYVAINQFHFLVGGGAQTDYSDYQVCQMVCFQTKNRNLGTFWRVLQWKMFVYFMDIWSMYFTDIWYIFSHLVYLVVLWYTFPRFGILHQVKSCNPADHCWRVYSMIIFTTSSQYKRSFLSGRPCVPTYVARVFSNWHIWPSHKDDTRLPCACWVCFCRWAQKNFFREKNESLKVVWKVWKFAQLEKVVISESQDASANFLLQPSEKSNFHVRR